MMVKGTRLHVKDENVGIEFGKCEKSLRTSPSPLHVNQVLIY